MLIVSVLRVAFRTILRVVSTLKASPIVLRLRVILIAQRIFRPIPLILRLILLFRSSILLNMRQCSMLILLRSVRLKNLLILLMTIPTN
nr:MAG TPA: hypothetical protein [Microviridae sp.]